jgi:hypothetical protein
MDALFLIQLDEQKMYVTKLYVTKLYVCHKFCIYFNKIKNK